MVDQLPKPPPLPPATPSEPTSVRRRRRTTEKPQSPVRRFMRRFGFEIIWLVVVVIGVFLLLEQMNIRDTLISGSQNTMAGLAKGGSQLGTTVADRLESFSLSDAIGIILVLGALLALALRIRWQLLRAVSLSRLKCPRCGAEIHRVHRRRLDRLVSYYVPVKRYRCFSSQCRWSGLRVDTRQRS